MKRGDLYRILGVARDASPHGIRSAYLRMAKDLHPDHAGEASTQAFRDLQLAYDVLSDPGRRREYDLELDRKRPARTWHAEPVSRRPPAEPLVPEPPPVAPGLRHPSRFFDDLMDRLLGDVTPIGIPLPVRPEVIDLNVTITHEHAVRGGVVAIGIPVREICPTCGGTGSDWRFACASCRAMGWIPRQRLMHLRIRPGTSSGTVIDLRPDDVGAGDVVLRLHLLVDRRTRSPPAR
jgi:DnaJ-class molecular chaperone